MSMQTHQFSKSKAAIEVNEKTDELAKAGSGSVVTRRKYPKMGQQNYKERKEKTFLDNQLKRLKK